MLYSYNIKFSAFFYVTRPNQRYLEQKVKKKKYWTFLVTLLIIFSPFFKEIRYEYGILRSTIGSRSEFISDWYIFWFFLPRSTKFASETYVRN